MKILFYHADYGTPMYEWVRVHILAELELHSCTIDVVNPVEFDSVAKANEMLVSKVNTEKYDLFFTPHNEKILYFETLKTIKMKNIPTLLICFDNLTAPFEHFNIAPLFDLVWLTSEETQYMFDRRQCKSIFLPYAANPNLPRSYEMTAGVGFVGTPYGSRTNMINRLTKNQIDVYCHCKKTDQMKPKERLKEDTISKGKVLKEFIAFKQGRKLIQGALANKFIKESKIIENDWLHYENVVNPYNIYEVYSRYSLTLSSTSARNTGILKKPLDIVNLRAFEIPMAGGIQFCRYSKEIARYFDDEKEIILFYDFDDMVEKAKYYLQPENKVIRDSIRKAARERAEKNHTWWHRFIKVFDELGISYN